MPDYVEGSNSLLVSHTRFPARVARLRVMEAFVQSTGLLAAVAHHGLLYVLSDTPWEIGCFVIASMALLTLSLAVRYRWSLAKKTFFSSRRGLFLVSGAWIVGCVCFSLFGEPSAVGGSTMISKATAVVIWSEFWVTVRAFFLAIGLTRRAAAVGGNAAMMLLISFFVLVFVGSSLLMLPRAHADPAALRETPLSDRVRIALFTATSASCVTGLTVVDTGGDQPYWSPVGQGIILALFQVGGLGIMTFGAFFAMAGRAPMTARESATHRDLLTSDANLSPRRLVRSILYFTISAELFGAVLVSSLWADRPLGERIFQSVFHSVSAFCNAGFALTSHSFVGWGGRWQVWGALSGLIIVGGIGFAGLSDLGRVAIARLRQRRKDPLFRKGKPDVRLSLTTRLVLVTTVGLLLSGTVGIFMLESGSNPSSEGVVARVGDAWFQSVTLRTAGFHAIDQAELQPATKFLAIGLMFIGASPGSTGGGVRTICFALVVLSIWSALRNRREVEVSGRTISHDLVMRALAIISLALIAVMATTLLIALFERRPERFLDHLFEATSALSTVGLSSIGTDRLSVPSQLVIVVAMFLGRVGPLTLLLALAGRTGEARYRYPEERVTLG